ncbi:glycosyltransferase family 2 protein [Mucilaginibacter sp. 14171R-50]|uniref:glycosyltransferase family 2 protein n=1 Tax=Mucilaginibacter sp. 14171R-50 TaxID=2703789 RepID=UPI00138C37D7|nr:glycosyltransferase family A protein [Mucilaginibacter sp. 14171R-50]QHS56342.1 glycosyltransferase family 2 protein [Mucilaginibacter sp. 14171R-50]
MNTRLAIVIPAYKIKFFDAALASVTNQSNKNFKVYISDDGSKEDIKAVAEKYVGRLDIEYHRFEDNAGSYDLVKHWNRSVELATEEWIWLFSDDDIMSPGCVQAFFDALKATNERHNIYRFNIEMIDADGRVICVKDPHPELESGFDFLQRRLQSRSLSAAVEYIFRKDAFKLNNGFVNFPKAYCSDDASWITFTGEIPIYTIRHETVSWRASGVNISSAKEFACSKALALLLFVKYIVKKYPSQKMALLQLARPWFFENLGYINGRLSFAEIRRISKQFNDTFETKGGSLKEITLFHLRRTRLGGVLYRWLKF